MDLKLLDGIVHGDLKPWKIDCSNKKKFAALLSSANTVTPETTKELLQQIKALLNDFPESKAKANSLAVTKPIEITPNYFSISLPVYTDTISQFYYLLITKESLLFFNNFLIKAATLTERVDIVYNTNQSLKSIRTLARQAAKEVNNLTKLAISDEQRQLAQFSLNTLKNVLIALYFDVQEHFRVYLKEVVTEADFYIRFLDETPPEAQHLVATVSLFNFRLNNILKAEEYKEQEAIDLLKQMQQYKGTETIKLQAALENYIYLQSQQTQVAKPDINFLTQEKEIQSYFNQAQVAISWQINEYNYGHQRANLLTSSIEELHYIKQGNNNKLSIPALLLKWLQQQKEMYQQNANATFAKLTDADTEAARLKSPLSKKDKATIDQQKQYALEHLAFMNGYNIKNEKIMTDADYNRMMEYTNYLIEKGKLPAGIKKIPQTGFASNAIRYTYYKIHEFLYGTQSIRQEWIDFLHAVFQQFKNTLPSTTRAKFSEKPKAYDADLKQMKR